MDRNPKPFFLKVLTGCIDELAIEFFGQKRVGKVPKELLQESGHTVYVVEEVLRIPEVKLRR